MTTTTYHWEEPWHTRGPANSGRKPPHFAYYTRVQCPTDLSIGLLIYFLKDLTTFTNAHYLWLDANSHSIEVWAHHDIINQVVKEIYWFIDQLHTHF